MLEHHTIVHTSFIIDSITQKKLANWRDYRHFEDAYLSKKKKIRHYLTRPSYMDTLAENLVLSENPKRDQPDVSLIKFLKGQKLPDSWSVFNHPKKSIFEFYKNSRLHWLSTWRVELNDWVGERARTVDRDKAADRWIMHIDIDFFFVAVALRKYPGFKVCLYFQVVIATQYNQTLGKTSCNMPWKGWGPGRFENG